MMPDAGTVTRRLVAAARCVDAGGGSRTDAPAAFLSAYRAWINAHHAVQGSPDERMDKIRLLLLAMTSAADLGEALTVLGRYGGYLLGDLRPLAIETVGATVRIVVDRAPVRGAAGLIRELWPLSLHLSLIEFLAGRILPGVRGEIRHPALLPAAVTGLLFDRPLLHGADALALCLPSAILRCPVAATSGEVAGFMPRLLPAPYAPAAAGPCHADLVRATLRVDLMRALTTPTGLPTVAHRLGCSVATLRRRLAREGTRFRDIRAGLIDDVARGWLRDHALPVSVIAERLGYTDGYAFRRAFRRTNGCSPTAFRRTMVRANM